MTAKCHAAGHSVLWLLITHSHTHMYYTPRSVLSRKIRSRCPQQEPSFSVPSSCCLFNDHPLSLSPRKPSACLHPFTAICWSDKWLHNGKTLQHSLFRQGTIFSPHNEEWLKRINCRLAHTYIHTDTHVYAMAVGKKPPRIPRQRTNRLCHIRHATTTASFSPFIGLSSLLFVAGC